MAGTTPGPRVERVLRVPSPVLAGYRAITSDLSATGMKFKSESPLQQGQEFQGDIELDDAEAHRMTLACRVRWCRQDGPHYVQFLELTRHKASRLVHFIDSLSDHGRGALLAYYEQFD